MAEDLRKKLAQSKIEGQQTNAGPWAPGVWDRAAQAFKSGWRMPEKLFPVLIKPGSPISSPEALKDFAGLDSVPEVMKVETAIWDEPEDEFVSEVVEICQISIERMLWLRENAGWHDAYVWIDGLKRQAYVVDSLEQIGRIEKWMLPFDKDNFPTRSTDENNEA